MRTQPFPPLARLPFRYPASVPLSFPHGWYVLVYSQRGGEGGSLILADGQRGLFSKTGKIGGMLHRRRRRCVAHLSSRRLTDYVSQRVHLKDFQYKSGYFRPEIYEMAPISKAKPDIESIRCREFGECTRMERRTVPEEGEAGGLWLAVEGFRVEGVRVEGLGLRNWGLGFRG